MFRPECVGPSTVDRFSWTGGPAQLFNSGVGSGEVASSSVNGERRDVSTAAGWLGEEVDEAR